MHTGGEPLSDADPQPAAWDDLAAAALAATAADASLIVRADGDVARVLGAAGDDACHATDVWIDAVRRAVGRGPAVVTPSGADDPGSRWAEAGRARVAAAPVPSSDPTLAVVAVRSPARPPFGEAELHALRALCPVAGALLGALRESASAATLREALRRQQEELVASEKMALLGRVTAGIAHEINSPLGGIMNSVRTARGYVEEYRASAGDPEITPEDHVAIATDILNALEIAEKAAAKVSQFVRSIKSQTRPGEAQSTRFDPAEEAESTIVLLHHRLKKENVAVRSELRRGLELHGDPGKFAVIVQNLVSNAIDAYGGGAGEIEVRLDGDGESVVLEVTDHGSGISDDVRDRVFEYLFTTKEVGKGTGLGLAMVHRLVTADFRGQIHLDTELGRGTTFRIILPVTRSE